MKNTNNDKSSNIKPINFGGYNKVKFIHAYGMMQKNSSFLDVIKDQEFKKAAKEDNFTGLIMLKYNDEFEIRESVDGSIIDTGIASLINKDYFKALIEEQFNSQKRRELDPSTELKKVTMKIDKEVYEKFSQYVRNELGSNVTAEIEKFMKNTNNSLKI